MVLNHLPRFMFACPFASQCALVSLQARVHTRTGMQLRTCAFVCGQMRERAIAWPFACMFIHPYLPYCHLLLLLLFPDMWPCAGLTLGTNISADLWQTLIITSLHFCPVILLPPQLPVPCSSVQSRWGEGGGFGVIMCLFCGVLLCHSPLMICHNFQTLCFKVTFICFAIFDLLLFC